MSKGGQYLTPHQQAIVKRFYEHREVMAQQKLGDLVTDLFMAGSEGDAKKAERLWKRVGALLTKTGANPDWVAKTLADRNLKELAEIVSALF